MKKILSLALVLTIITGLVPVLVYANDSDAVFYSWQMEDTGLVSVSDNGATQNNLTLVEGSVIGGTLKNAMFTLAEPITLSHNKEWVIEWKSTGNWEGMLLASTTRSPSMGLTYLFRHADTRIFSFGEYNGIWNNYGMTFDIDMNTPHVFRLENRIADGVNAVYLRIDGNEIDRMDHYYVSAADKNQRVNWAKGRDIIFANIGTQTHKITNMQLEYLRIWEDTHGHSYTAIVTDPTCEEAGYTTYTCSCGDSYKGDYTEPLGGTHIRSEWTEYTLPSCNAEGKDIRVCSACNKAEYRDTRITGDTNKILVSNPLPKEYFMGKNIVTIGDSITYGVNTTKTYGQYLSESLGVNVTNKGVSGSGYCSGGKMQTNKTLTENNVRDADIITIMLGVNDWAWSVKDGSWNGNPSYYDKSWTYYQLGNFDSTDTSTFYGALHSWCRDIVRINKLEGFEDKQFYVITPLITSWNNSVTGARDWNQDKLNIHGHKFREYCTAIMEVCAYYEIPVFDANMFSGIYYKSDSDNNIGLTGGDGVHVNAEGHALLANALEEFLLENYSYEDRSIASGGHGYLNGTCQSCRLPRKAPVIKGISNYTIAIDGIEEANEIRFAVGTYTTGTEVKAAEQNVTLDAATVAKHTVDGVFTYDLPWVGTYTFWVRANDGSSYFLYTDVTEIDPYVTSYGVKLTVNDFGENYKDVWLAKGTFNSYSEIKASTEFKYQASANKLANYAKTTHDFTYTMEDPGDYTVLIRYNDGTYDVIHHTITVTTPVLVENGLQAIIQNIPDIKIIRTAYGHYESVADIKNASTVRYFNNKAAIKNAEEYMIQYREEGEVTIIVEYNDGYKHYFYYNVAKKVPTYTLEGDTITFGSLDDLYIIRYALGKYTTSNNIKNAPDSKYVKTVNENGEIVISGLTEGRWSFMVQYNDDSYNFYVIDV